MHIENDRKLFVRRFRRSKNIQSVCFVLIVHIFDIKMCEERLGWKKSTTYTTIRKLCQKGYIQNEHAMVSVLIPQERVQSDESAYFVDRTFSGSLPRFIAAFLGERNISDNEAKEIQEMIDRYRKEQ